MRFLPIVISSNNNKNGKWKVETNGIVLVSKIIITLPIQLSVEISDLISLYAWAVW